MSHCHAALRAQERYGVTLNIGDLFMLCLQCRDGSSRRIAVNADRYEHHIVEHKGTEMYAIYDPVRDNIVTFWPRETLRSVGALATLAEARRIA